MPKSKRPTCFISYCRENADSDSIEHFVQGLRQVARNQVSFLFDEDLNPGDDLPAFMAMLDSVDGVILILTPEYRQRVETRRGGVYEEYSRIILRYEEQQSDANSIHERDTTILPSPFCLVPVLFSGSYETACPPDLRRPLTVDFTQYRAHRAPTGSIYISSAVHGRHSAKISKIVSQLITRYSSRKEQVSRSFEELLSSFFLNTKHDHLRGDPKFEAELEHVFVKTFTYKKVRQQVSYLLVGRKGSGKSTIVDYLSRDSEDRYKAAIEINVDNFDLEHIYTVLTPARIHAEFDSLISRVEVFEAIWELFLSVCCMNTLAAEGELGRLRQAQLQHLPPVDRFLSRIAGAKNGKSGTFDFRAIFRWCYSRVVDQIDKAIEASRDEPAGFSFDLSTSLERERLIENSLEEEVHSAFVSILQGCTRRFLISLDGFDTAFERFRVRTQQDTPELSERRRRTMFETDWLSGFAHVVITMKSSPRRTPLSNLTDFCATIPKDRFVEIRDSERDGYIYIGKCYEIRWSAIELAILLYKRLEVLGGEFRTNRNDQPHKRLEAVLRNSFSYIPLETTTTMDGVDHTMPLFVDVLRHTFWRPREIMIYFAKIIAVLRDLKKRNIEATPFAVGKCISDTTREIIRTEFLNEFQRHCTNLASIIKGFRRGRQILEPEEVERLLGGVPFQFIDRDAPVTDLPTQLRFLYEIGFIGLEASKSIVDRLKLLHTDIFWFNAGDEPFEILLQESFADCRFIIHPIFCEFLDLDVRGQRLTMKFDWNYLERQESHVIVPA